MMPISNTKEIQLLKEQRATMTPLVSSAKCGEYGHYMRECDGVENLQKVNERLIRLIKNKLLQGAVGERPGVPGIKTGSKSIKTVEVVKNTIPKGLAGSSSDVSVQTGGITQKQYLIPYSTDLFTIDI